MYENDTDLGQRAEDRRLADTTCHKALVRPPVFRASNDLYGQPPGRVNHDIASAPAWNDVIPGRRQAMNRATTNDSNRSEACFAAQPSGESLISDRLVMARMAFGQLNAKERREFCRQFSEKPSEPAQKTPARVLRRGDVARRLARSERAVDRLAAEGALRKVRIPGRVRALGFLEADVEAMLEGGL